MSRGDDSDWVDRFSRIAGWLGFNPVQVRWKLERMRQNWRDSGRRAKQTVQHINYAHKLCGRCGRINDRGEKRCSGCGARLGGRLWNRLQRVGLGLPEILSVSSLLGLALVLVFARLVLAEGGPDSFWSFRVDTLFRFGGHSPEAVWQGEWWRLATGIFLHAGLWHLGFNLFALSQIGPAIEEVFGRSRMVLFFMLTGILASLGSTFLREGGVGIGASGAIMGLCGMAAGWGQRDGTTQGKAIRNLMLKWGLYTLIFGLVIGADNVAHAVGFGSGAVIGLAFNPALLRRSQRFGIVMLQALLGGGAALGAFALCLLPPASPLQASYERIYDDEDGGNPYAPILEVCRQFDAGKREPALAAYRHSFQGEGVEVSAEQLQMVCESMARQVETCAAFRKEGLQALLPKGATLPPGTDALELERQWRSICDWLEQGGRE